MKVTKYEHACLVIEDGDEQLVIDPGTFTSDLPELTAMSGLVITHEHQDHLDPAKIKALLAANPEAKVYALAEVLDKLPDVAAERKQVVAGGDEQTVGPFKLNFFGHDHAIIYQTVPCQNVGVMVNDTLYYPGDSFTLPEKPVDVLALPVSAPWLKTSEAIDFVLKVKPRLAFATHDAVLSEAGKMVSNIWIDKVTSGTETIWKILKPGESVETQ